MLPKYKQQRSKGDQGKMWYKVFSGPDFLQWIISLMNSTRQSVVFSGWLYPVLKKDLGKLMEICYIVYENIHTSTTV